ncbi:MAG: hypothetical protein ACLRTQ_09410 [Candidatus Borkfalkia sp.]
MESFFKMWYDFILSLFNTEGMMLTAETQNFIGFIVLCLAIFGVITSPSFKLVKYIFYAILCLGR